VKEFAYARAAGVRDAMVAATAMPGELVRYLAGGTNLVDLMRVGVERPDQVVDLGRLPLADIEELPDGGLRIGALARNSDVAADERVRRRYPLLARAILNGASPQIRNKATVGGNLLQRTRCPYFYDLTAACNKRIPGSGCDALLGMNRTHAILGASDSCIAVHPSDMCVALAALDAAVTVEGPGGTRRRVPVTGLHRLPGDSPHIETVLAPGELVTAVDLPAPRPGRSAYVKVRDRASYAFALISAAAQVHVEAGRIALARIALGGVAAKPWRAYRAEDLLIGSEPSAGTFRRSTAEAVAGARTRRDNAFKPELARRLIERTLTELTSNHNSTGRAS
jgi:xanthine dehydrogenase YagS FAD-binding subunit